VSVSVGSPTRHAASHSAARLITAALVLSVATSALSANCTNDQDASAALYVTEANMDRIAAYHICPDGEVRKHPFQLVSVGENPRRLLAACVTAGGRFEMCAHGAEESQPRALYVATRSRIESFRIDPDTKRLSCFGEADGQCPAVEKREGPTALNGANFQYLAIHPTGRYLYAAATGLDRIVGYELNADDGSFREQADGSIEIGSCTQGAGLTRYQGLAATETELYASGHLPGRIDIFSLAESGAILAFSQEPGRCSTNKDRSCTVDSDCREDTVCVRSYCDGFPDDVDTVTECTTDADCQSDDACPEDGECACVTEQEQVFTDCSESSRERTYPTSKSQWFDDPKALLLNTFDDPEALPQNKSTLYIVDQFRRRIYGCPIEDTDGTLPDCPNSKGLSNVSRTNERGKSEQLALSKDNVLFASVFDRGTVAAYKLSDDPVPGTLPRKSKTRSEPNILSAPVGLAACDDTLYVAQGDLDKVQAYRIGSKGFKKRRPISRTARIKGSFPNDVAVVPLGPATCNP
jgi:6-phosphogluconolactonase (cycloisomerase 2 family)